MTKTSNRKKCDTDAICDFFSGGDYHLYLPLPTSHAANLYFLFCRRRRKINQKTLKSAFGFITGFTIIFVLLGALAGTVGSLLREYQTAVNLVSGLVVILFGLNFLGVFHLNLFKGSRFSVRTRKTWVSFPHCFSASFFPSAGRPVSALFWVRR